MAKRGGLKPHNSKNSVKKYLQLWKELVSTVTLEEALLSNFSQSNCKRLKAALKIMPSRHLEKKFFLNNSSFLQLILPDSKLMTVTNDT